MSGEVAALSASLERELKLCAPGDFELPAMAGALPGLSDGPPVRLELDATYFDTADLVLARAGATVRYRRGESGPPWTVKLPQRTHGAELTRRELRFDGAPDTVPSAARDVLRAYLRSRPLRPVARLHTDRTCVPLLDEAGTRLAELVDDHVSAYHGRRLTGAFREVELELTATHHTGRLQRAALRRLTAAGCHAAAPRPKLVQALGDPATAPAELTITPLGDDPSVSELIRHALSTSVDRLLRHDAGMRLGDDPEDVHQFRVAARTLRSNLKTFAPVLDPEWADALRTELGWLGTEAGRVRDLDVLGQRLHRLTECLGTDDAAAAELLLQRITDEGEQARPLALAALRCHRYDSLLDALVEATATPALADPSKVDVPAGDFLRRVARKQVRRLHRTVAALSDPPTDHELHLVRIQAKRTRYAIEAARPVIGAPAAHHAAELAHLQDVLGDLHDSTVAVQWLRQTAHDQPTTALAAGQLIAAEYAEQARLRRQLPDGWHAVDNKKLRLWL